MKNSPRIPFSLCLLIFFTFGFTITNQLNAQSTSWKGTGSNSWSTASNWTNGVPTSTVNAIIGDAAFTGVVRPTVDGSSNCLSLTVGGNVNAVLTISKSLTVWSNLNIMSGGNINHRGVSLTVKGNWSNSGIYTFINNSVTIFAGASQSISGPSANDFRKLTVNTGSTVSLNTNISVASAFTVNGTFIPVENPTPYVVSGSGTLAVGSTGVLKVTAANFAGNYTLTGATYTAGNTVEYNASTINQTISNTITYSNLKISGGLIKTLAGNLTALNSSTAAMGNIYVISGTLDLSTFTANRGVTVAGGVLSVSNGAKLRIGGSNIYPTGYTTNTLSLTSTTEYYGSGMQAVAAQTYGNLLLTSASGVATKTLPATDLTVAGDLTSLIGTGTAVIYTAASNITVNGNLNIGTSTTFNAGSFSHRLTGNTVNSGTLTGSTSTITLAGSGASLSGSGTYNFNNLSVSASGNTIADITNVTVAGNLSTTGAGALTHTSGTGLFTMSGTAKNITGSSINFSNLSCTGTIANTSSFGVTGNLTVGGSLTATAGIITLSGATKTISGAGTISLSSLSVPGSITTSSNFTIGTFMDVSGSFFATTSSIATFTGTSTLNGTANLFNVVINGTSLQLATDAVLGIANNFTITAGNLNVTSSIPNTVNYNGTVGQNILTTVYHHLNITNASTKTAINPLTTNGDLTIGTGATFVPGNFTHTLNGNWNNNGSFTAGSSTITMNGSDNTSITGSTTFNNLTINKNVASTLVTQASNISAFAVTITNGTLNTGSNILTITNSRSGIGIILGTIQRTHTFNTGIDYAFEGPDNTIRFSAVLGVTSITVKVTKGAVGDFPFGGSLNRTYDISVPAGSYVAALRLHYEDGELNGNIEATQQLWNYNGSSWQVSGKTSNNTISNYVEKTLLNSITNRWTLSDDANVVRWNGSVSSDWGTAANWTTLQGSPSRPPGTNDIVEIGTTAFTNQPTISTNTTIKSLVFGSVQAATLTLNTAGTFTTAIGNISGNWLANANHTINVNNQLLNVGGDLALSDGSANHTINVGVSTGTINLNGSLIQTGGANITFSAAGALNIGTDYLYTSGTITSSTGTITYNGITNQIVAGVSYNNLVINKSAGIASLSGAQTIIGNLSIVAGEFDNTANTVLAGNLTISSGAILKNLSTFHLAGNWTNNGSYSGLNSAVYFEGTGTQNINTTTFNNLIINKTSGSAVLTGNINIDGNLTISAGTLDVQNYTANRTTAGGQLTVSAGAALIVGGANNLPANFTTYSLNAGSTITYNATVAQSIGGIAYGNLQLSNGGSNAKTLAASTIVNGNLTINTGVNFNAATYNIDLYGNWINNGTFVPATSTVLLEGISKTITGNTTFNKVAIYGSYTALGSDIVYNSTLRVVTGGSYNGGSGTATLYGDLTNSGSLTSNGTTNFMGTVVQTIRLTNAITSNSSGIINFNGTVSPVLNSTSTPSFATLNVNNTGGINPSVDWNVFVAMNVSAGATFNGGATKQNIYGSFTNNGFVTSSGTLNFSPSSPQTYTLAGTTFTSTGTVIFGGSAAVTVNGTPTLKDVTISNNVGVTPGAGWAIGGNLAITGTGILNAGNKSYTVAGDIESGGTINEGTSTFTMTSATGQLTGSTTTTFYDFVVSATGNIIVNADFNVAHNFTNNNLFDASVGSPVFTGSTAGIITGSAASFALAQFDVSKDAGVTVTLAKNISTVTAINVNSGILDVASTTITQDATAGALNLLTVAANATMKLTGPPALPVFTDYTIDSLSTIEYAGVIQTITSVSALARTYGNLTISTTGTKTANGPINIRNNFTLTNGTFVQGSFADTLGGNWLMSTGVLTSTGATLVLNGTGEQSIGSTGAFNNLTFNKSAGSTTLSSNLTVAGTIIFNSGKITTGSNTLIMSSTTGTVTGAAQGSGWVFGKLQKAIPAGATSRTFEVGGNTYYSPATIAFASVTTAGSLTVNATAADHPFITTSGINENKNVNRYFTITNNSTVFSVAGATVTLNFVASDLDAGAAFANFKVRSYNGAAWNTTLVTANPLATSIQATTVTSFGDFAMGELLTATTWNGSVNTDWSNASNWSSGIPTASTNVIIPGSLSTYPILAGGTGTFTNITIASGASVTNNATLLIAGTISNSGTFTSTSGVIEMNNTNAQTIPANTFASNNIKGLIVSSNVTLGGPLGITDVLSFGNVNSKTLTTAGNLTIRSSALNTARIADITNAGVNSGNTIAGNVTVERFINAALGYRAYRTLGSSVNTSTTINSNWQEGGNNTSVTVNQPGNGGTGYGTHITGSTTGANGFDATQTGQPSLLTYNGTYQPVTNTNINTLNATTGYLMYVRGDRSDVSRINATGSSGNTILRATGTLLTGDVPYTLRGDNLFTLVTNPYASPLNWSTVYADGGTGIENFYTYVDPRVGTQGGYVTVTNTGFNSTAGTNANLNIQSGQAFFVKSTNIAQPHTLTIKETHKSNINNVNVFRTGSQEQLSIGLFFTLNGAQRVADGVNMLFNNNYSADVDANDAGQITNFDEDISIKRSGKYLAIETRPLIDQFDTIFLNMTHMKQKDYTFEFNPASFKAPGLQAYLQDKFLGSETPVSLTEQTIVPFTVSSNIASNVADRFNVVFRNNTVLPINFTNVKAFEKGNSIQVEWNLGNEKSMKQYEIEKSTDGRTFTKAGMQTARATMSADNYQYLDQQPNTGNVYYRIKAIAKDGTIKYSEVVNVKVGKGDSDITVYPNPITDHIINLQLVNQPKGKYSIRLINQLGQEVYNKELNHIGGSATETLSIGTRITKGVYTLNVIAGNKSTNQKLFIQ